jgi:hypothetical protein
MLSYAFLEEEEVEQKKPPSLITKQMVAPTMVPTKSPVSQDETECNLVVMFFVFGVLILAVMDSTKR